MTISLVRSSKMSKSGSEIIAALKNTSEGLLYMSESDYPFEVFLWSNQAKEDFTTDKLLQQIGCPRDTPVELVDIDDFFDNPTSEKDWHDEAEKETVRKYRHLVEVLKRNLTDIKVYRVGEIEIDVYIVGKTQSGDLALMTTKVIET
jgi:hypothetical protein